MKNRQPKRVMAMLLTCMLVITAILTQSVTTVQAAQKLVYKSGVVIVSADQMTKNRFSVKQDASLTAYILLRESAEATIGLYDNKGNACAEPVTVSESEWQQDERGYIQQISFEVSAGSYYMTVTCSKDLQYQLLIYQEASGSGMDSSAEISASAISLVAGRTKSLSVSGATVSSWKSANTKVAKVDRNGTVTGVKKGRTTITATTKDGTKLTCTVTVYANQYEVQKLTLEDLEAGSAALGVYKMTYDKSGNLVLYATYVNNSGYRIGQLRSIKLTIADKNGSVIGVFQKSAVNVDVKSGTVKNIKFVIPKSELKIKNADLTSVPTENITGSFDSVAK